MEQLNFENLSPREKEKIARKFRDSESFLYAETPLEYNFTLPSGEKLKAWQSNRGQGFIAIERDGKEIFNAQKLLPEGWKFVTPKYFKKHPKEEGLFDYLGSGWTASPERKMILLGELKTPRDLLGLFHEIAHAVNDTEKELEIEQQLEDEEYAAARDQTYKTLLGEEKAKLLSKIERRAWAWALRAMRNIQRETGVDLKSVFGSSAEFKQYINECLATGRRAFEWIIKDGHDPDFYKEMQQYFDKWQYKRDIRSKQ